MEENIINLLSLLVKFQEDIVNKINYLTSMNFKTVYQNPFEYNFLKENWGGGYQKYLNADIYKELVSGLSEEDTLKITSFLSRMERILDSNGGAIDLFRQEEMEEVNFVQKNFFSQIIPLIDGNFAYGKWILPINHFEKGIFVDHHGIGLLNKENYKEKAIIDVGAFVGDSACILSEYTENNVYCFEALDDNYEMLLETVELNGLKNVRCYNYALGDKVTSSKVENLYEDIASGSCCRLVSGENAEETGFQVVKVDTLDNFVSRNGIEVGLIKVDIEGAEQKFIEGSVETIKTQKPSIIMSIYHNPSDFFEIKTILTNLVPEYKFKIFKPIDGAACIDTVLLCEV